jgi:hypothetical protein
MLGQGARIHASASPRPVFPDAQSASLRENRPSRDLRLFPVSPSDPGLPTPRRGGLRTPAMAPSLHPGMSPVGHRVIVNACGGNGMPRLASSLTTRTHRVRPSEKNAARVIPGFSTQGHPSSDSPPPGGAGSARPQRWQCLHRKITPLRRPACYAPMIMLFLGLRPGRYLRTRRAHPSEKITFRAIPGPSSARPP